MPERHPPPLTRRRFLSGVSKSTMGLALGGTAASLLAACGTDDDPTLTDPGDGGSPVATAPPSPTATSGPEGGAVVGDVIDYALTSDEWSGDFGWVQMRLRRGVVDGADVTFIRTDASDEAFAETEQLVFVPRMTVLADGLAGTAYVFEDPEHPVVLSTEPGRDDYTPAWHVHRVTWQGTARELRSVAEVQEAESGGELTVEATGIVFNGPLVTWSDGALPVDDERTGYLGPGQLLEEPDLDELTVRFKLHECFPGSRYIVVDTSAPPMAEGMAIAAAPPLAQATDAGATGRVNVFMGGVEGPGPMGGQPSVFDSRAGDPVWSPYWDHLTYVWKDDATPRVLADEAAVHAARDAGELDEFVGTPDTGGQGFVVNCPVPVVAPNTFTG
ncbi:MAG: hypothetical protein KY469_06665 [Actinobacteria bacterium]|nr:hypothetical protein [Actinomycetota bacterium]